MESKDQQILDQLNQITEKLSALETQSLLNKEIFNFEEACRYLKRSESHIYKLTATHKIAFYRPTGKLIVFRREDLDQWLLQNRQSTTDEVQQTANQFTLKGNSKKSIL